MDGDVLGKRGFSLIELSLVLAVTAVLLAVTLYSAREIKRVASAERVIKELSSIAAASTRFYSEKGSWPDTLLDLRTSGYLVPGSSDLNPFGNAYVITGRDQAVSISCVLPKGLITTRSMGSGVVVVNQGSNDLVSVTKPVESGIWKLKYEKKYIYHQ